MTKLDAAKIWFGNDYLEPEDETRIATTLGISKESIDALLCHSKAYLHEKISWEAGRALIQEIENKF